MINREDMFIPPSELILNPDNSIYHLNLIPGDLATTIITVGDLGRVDLITKHFDTILLEKKHREFRTVTGEISSCKLSVVATGIGPDNIDIVLNEVDALFNVDFSNRTIKEQLVPLNFIRLGTSGSIREEVPVDSLVISRNAVGMDGLLNNYHSESKQNSGLKQNIKKALGEETFPLYAFDGSSRLCSHFEALGTMGITLTANGFYGPQSRGIRLSPKLNLMDKFKEFEYDNLRITNLEMETAAIYGLSSMLGHQAVSINAILANRVDNRFSKNPRNTIEKMIESSLEKIVALVSER